MVPTAVLEPFWLLVLNWHPLSWLRYLFLLHCSLVVSFQWILLCDMRAKSFECLPYVLGVSCTDCKGDAYHQFVSRCSLICITRADNIGFRFGVRSVGVLLGHHGLWGLSSVSHCSVALGWLRLRKGYTCMKRLRSHCWVFGCILLSSRNTTRILLSLWRSSICRVRVHDNKKVLSGEEASHYRNR